MEMSTRAVVLWVLLAGIGLTLLPIPYASASLCQRVETSTRYPQMALPGKVISVTTAVVGSCTSDGEDYFAVRVDLVDKKSSAILSSNSTPIGYDANNFSVKVHNSAASPRTSQTWAVDVNTYLIEAGAASGGYLLNSTSIAIRIGNDPLGELQPARLSILVLAVIALDFKAENAS